MERSIGLSRTGKIIYTLKSSAWPVFKVSVFNAVCFFCILAGVRTGVIKDTSTWPRTDTTTVVLLQQLATLLFKEDTSSIKTWYQKATLVSQRLSFSLKPISVVKKESPDTCDFVSHSLIETVREKPQTLGVV